MRSLIITYCIFIFFCNPFSVAISSTSHKTPFDKIVFFGDSLSDNGNFYNFVLGYMPKSPPYFNGRFANGPTWAEHVEKYFFDKSYVVGLNYAV
jgi:phospholipase/lecithinase/hemolysin